MLELCLETFILSFLFLNQSQPTNLKRTFRISFPGTSSQSDALLLSTLTLLLPPRSTHAPPRMRSESPSRCFLPTLSSIYYLLSLLTNHNLYHLTNCTSPRKTQSRTQDQVKSQKGAIHTKEGGSSKSKEKKKERSKQRVKGKRKALERCQRA